jgi:glycosyltransferase involved in cell wall biosynthesis
MKTVLHLIETSGPGGAEKMLISLVEHLNVKKYKSIICLLKDGWLNSQLKSRGFETVIIPQVRIFDFRWMIRLIDLLRYKKCNLMHAHEFAMNSYGTLISAITRIPIVTTVHGKNYYWSKWRRRLAYRFVSKHSRMVVVSEDIKKFLIKYVGIKSGRVTTIYNGIDFNSYCSDNGSRNKVRKELGIDEKQSVIGTVGNLYSVKGHTYLLKAFAIIKNRFPSAVVVIAGRGGLLDKLQKESADLNIQNNIRFLGFREDIHDLLQAMDVFVLPSISEGLPLSALEAMASKKPVVATDVGGMPEVVMNGQTGFTVPSKNPKSLAEKIMFLLENKNLADEMAEKSRNRVEKEFALENMVSRYQELYDNIFESGRCNICQ